MEGKRKMKNLKNKVIVCVSSVSALAFSALPAFAEPAGFTIPSLPMDDLYTLSTAVLAGLATIWVLRKIIKTTNRS